MSLRSIHGHVYGQIPIYSVNEHIMALRHAWLKMWDNLSRLLGKSKRRWQREPLAVRSKKSFTRWRFIVFKTSLVFFAQSGWATSFLNVCLPKRRRIDFNWSNPWPYMDIYMAIHIWSYPDQTYVSWWCQTKSVGGQQRVDKASKGLTESLKKGVTSFLLEIDV